MIRLTERERILRVYKRQEIDRIPMIDNAWRGTINRWYNEGMPKDVAWEDYFGFDRACRIYGKGDRGHVHRAVNRGYPRQLFGACQEP